MDIMTFQIAKLDIKDPLKCLAAIKRQYNHCFLLESAIKGDLRLSRYSFIGFDPETTIEVKGNQLKINNKKSKVEDPFEILKKYANKYKCSSFFPFSGGLVGYI